MKTEEGKSMEKAAEQKYPVLMQHCNGGHYGMFGMCDVNYYERQAFIAGWQERDKEIERLKGLLRKEFEKSFRFPKRVNVNAEWEHYSNSNNL